jgi:serine/threonine protein kinase
MSQPRIEMPGSKSRSRLSVDRPPETEDVLASPGPSTDDTPTIISRQPPALLPPEGNAATSIRGRQLAHFELLEPIGIGGMAAVLRARDTQLDRLVALKILPPEMSGDDETVRRFHQEARSAAKLDHENIARVFFCGEDQRLHFIAFEFVEGENLRAILEERGRLPVGEAIHYMLQVAAGLAHASQRGVVHRDIKPSNIIVTPAGRAKLVDMGLARCLAARTDRDLTQSGVTLGTFDYMSPEQALEPRDADVRSDIYSLGCTFYHMLTGQPPVPEGTAAQKLKHHQHVKPLDPRQIVPDLPAEVVVILDRMMAKQPRDRFQTPQQLVAQLVIAARKLGVCPDVPEGILTVETDLPNPPGSRPLLWSALAAAAVVALVLLLDHAPSGPVMPTGPRPINSDDGAPADKGDTLVSPKTVKQLPGPAETGPAVAVYTPPAEPTARHLLGWLEEHRNATRIKLLLAGDLDLSPRDGEFLGLVLAAQHVTIMPHNPRNKPTLRFQIPSIPPDKPLVALTINAKESLVEGIRFIVDARGTPDTTVIGLLLQGGNRHTVQRCEFLQAMPSSQEGAKRLASVVAEAGRLRPEVFLRDCAFLGFGKATAGTDVRLSEAEKGGQDAVVRRGAVRITTEGCVFGPHSAAFRLEGDAGGDEGLLSVQQCSVMLAARRSAVFEVAPGGAGKLDVAHSLFSRMVGDDSSEGAVLLREADGRDAISYHGRDNCYHRLDGYWAVGSAWQQAGWGQMRHKLREGRGQDDSRVLVFSPWLLSPSRQSEALNKQDLEQAFHIRLDLAALRKLGRSGTEVVGSEGILGQRWLPATLPAFDDKTEQAVRRFLVVEDGLLGDSSNGVYPSLDAAVAIARPGDTILLRHNGEMPINPVHLNKKGLGDLTIRPARRFRPVLELGETVDTDTALFRVHDGKLRLEGLEFRLLPKDKLEKLTMQTVVALVGNGECTLRNCVATLQGPGKMRLALATLTSTGKVMKLDMPPTRTPDQGPKLVVEGCFIRGEGDLLWTRASRPFGMEVNKSLAALSGDLVSIGVLPGAEVPKDTQRTQVSLQGTTTWLGGSLIRLSAGKDVPNLVPVTCKAVNCLFIPAGRDKNLISLEGAETEEKLLREKLTWEGGPNTYGRFKALQTQQPLGEEMPLPSSSLGPEKWKALSGEETSVFAAELSRSPPAETRFSQVDPIQFTPPRDASESGVPLTAVPRPTPAAASER